MNRKVCLIFMLFAVGLVMLGVTVHAQQTIVIRTEHDEPSGSTTDQLLNQMGKEIAAATQNRVQIQVHSSASLSGGKIPTMIQNLQAGNEELALISSGQYSTIDPRLAVASLPFMCGSIDDLEYLARKSGILDKIYAAQDAKNIRVVDAWTRALRQIVNNKREIKSPADMKGLRFRVPEIKLWIDTFKAMGATPVPLPFSEIPTALQLGTIDGAERPSELLRTESWWDMAKYVTMLNYTGDDNMVAFNKAFWDKLDKSTQALLTQKLKEYGDKKFEVEKSGEKITIDELGKHGMKVTILTPEQLKVFRTAMQPVWREYESRIGNDLITAAEKAVQSRK